MWSDLKDVPLLINHLKKWDPSSLFRSGIGIVEIPANICLGLSEAFNNMHVWLSQICTLIPMDNIGEVAAKHLWHHLSPGKNNKILCKKLNVTNLIAPKRADDGGCRATQQIDHQPIQQPDKHVYLLRSVSSVIELRKSGL